MSKKDKRGVAVYPNSKIGDDESLLSPSATLWIKCYLMPFVKKKLGNDEWKIKWHSSFIEFESKWGLFMWWIWG